MGIRVIAFDDNSRLRDSMTLLLKESKDIDFIRSFADCTNLVNEVAQAAPDVVIMDIDMPVVNGIEGVRLIKKHFPDIKVLMQTVFDDDEKVFAAICAGARGYILKNGQPGRLPEAIREVFNGGAPMSPAIASMVLKQFQTFRQPTANEDYNLSKREMEVLELLVKGKSYKMIADALSITYDTVRAHMKKIYEKLHVSSMTEAVAKAINEKMF